MSVSVPLCESPFSPRGRLPFKFPFRDEEKGKLLRQIPGTAISWSQEHVRCTWECIPAVARVLRIPKEEWPRPKLPRGFWAGEDRFNELGFPDILGDYQMRMVKVMGRHDAFVCTDKMRLGKTIESLAAVTRRGAKRVLVLCPGYARPTWRKEIPKWLRVDPLILDGRSADRARFGSGLWVRGRAELHDAIETHPIHVANFDIFAAQKISDAAGGLHERDDLTGCSPLLRQHEWDAVIIDEAHELKKPFSAIRGRDTRADLIEQVVGDSRRVPIVYILTATPMTGKVWHYFQLMRLAFGLERLRPYSRRRANPLFGTVFKFQARYCAGHHETTTFRSRNGVESRQKWNADGVSNPKEFSARKKRFSLGRTPETAGVNLPPIIRTITELELDPKRKTIPLPTKKGTTQTKLMQMAAKTISIKGPAACAEALRGCYANGEKSAIFVRYHQSHARVLKVLHKALREYSGPRSKKRMDVLVLACTGKTNRDVRAEICERFVLHEGPAIIVATIDSLPGSISLRGLKVNHFTEWHDKLDKTLQAEARGHEPGTTGVSSIFYTVEGTGDTAIAERTINSLNAIARIEGDKDAELFAMRIQEKLNKDIDDILVAMAEADRYNSACLEDIESDGI